MVDIPIHDEDAVDPQFVQGQPGRRRPRLLNRQKPMAPPVRALVAGRADDTQGLPVFAADEASSVASQSAPTAMRATSYEAGLTTVSWSRSPPPDLAIAQTSSM